ncbi:hypothetical protein BJ508DRAFT_310095 [Ascobolus immersus RN42]|uniref:Uncharacterized protein n=1 Tax=Ascobolus immersus RN42 TaxID=1160509 RepID=A0A3N4HUZ9_ASCIM|nr:hypothetical protein BJ508DRAFT_310095 [Ascobolus immersus RN42]
MSTSKSPHSPAGAAPITPPPSSPPASPSPPNAQAKPRKQMQPHLFTTSLDPTSFYNTQDHLVEDEGLAARLRIPIGIPMMEFGVLDNPEPYTKTLIQITTMPSNPPPINTSDSTSTSTILEPTKPTSTPMPHSFSTTLRAESLTHFLRLPLGYIVYVAPDEPMPITCSCCLTPLKEDTPYILCEADGCIKNTSGSPFCNTDALFGATKGVRCLPCVRSCQVAMCGEWKSCERFEMVSEQEETYVRNRELREERRRKKVEKKISKGKRERAGGERKKTLLEMAIEAALRGEVEVQSAE